MTFFPWLRRNASWLVPLAGGIGWIVLWGWGLKVDTSEYRLRLALDSVYRAENRAILLDLSCHAHGHTAAECDKPVIP